MKSKNTYLKIGKIPTFIYYLSKKRKEKKLNSKIDVRSIVYDILIVNYDKFVILYY